MLRVPFSIARPHATTRQVAVLQHTPPRSPSAQHYPRYYFSSQRTMSKDSGSRLLPFLIVLLHSTAFLWQVSKTALNPSKDILSFARHCVSLCFNLTMRFRHAPISPCTKANHLHTIGHSLSQDNLITSFHLFCTTSIKSHRRYPMTVRSRRRLTKRCIVLTPYAT